MHYFAAVVVPPDTTIDNAEERVVPILEPYDENREDTDQWDKWDWWQVGGRWTGVWSDYEPRTDPANIKTCRICYGTGMRMDGLGVQARSLNPEYTCNGCDGKGAAVEWPTQWRPTSGEILPVAALLDNPGLARPFAVVIPDGGWHERETWIWDEEKQEGHFDEIPETEWPEVVAKLLAPCRSAALVVVDYHC